MPLYERGKCLALHSSPALRRSGVSKAHLSSPPSPPRRGGRLAERARHKGLGGICTKLLSLPSITPSVAQNDLFVQGVKHFIAGFENQKCNKGGEFHDRLQEVSYSRKLRPYNIHPNRRSIVLLFLVERVLPEPPYFLFIIGIFGKILYKHFLFVPGPDDLERCLKDGNRQDQCRLEKEDLHDIPVDVYGIKRVPGIIIDVCHPEFVCICSIVRYVRAEYRKIDCTTLLNPCPPVFYSQGLFLYLVSSHVRVTRSETSFMAQVIAMSYQYFPD